VQCPAVIAPYKRLIAPCRVDIAKTDMENVMSRQGDLMWRSIKRYLIPELVALGFVGKTSTFQRHDGQWLDLLSLQY